MKLYLVLILFWGSSGIISFQFSAKEGLSHIEIENYVKNNFQDKAVKHISIWSWR